MTGAWRVTASHWLFIVSTIHEVTRNISLAHMHDVGLTLGIRFTPHVSAALKYIHSMKPTSDPN